MCPARRALEAFGAKPMQESDSESADPGRGSLRALLLATVALSFVGKIGESIAPMLIDAQQWALLLSLNASDASCLLAAAAASTAASARVAWWTVALSRRLVEDGVHYRIGFSHGAAAAS